MAVPTCRTYLVISSLLALSSTYNLDHRIPVIKTSTEGTYFGYSVAQHRITRSGRTVENVILVGAPKADTNQPGTNKTGAVYRCSANVNSNDCRQINIENNNKRPPKDVLKDDQWLGVTVQSQGAGGYVMACAHRYVAAGTDHRWGLGICYSLNQDLSFYMKWNPCSGRPKYRAHQGYGFCQAGTSGALTKNNEIVIGSPGPFTWRGTIFKNSVSFGLSDDKSWYMSPVAGDKSDKSPVKKYSYLGMSITVGKFFDGIDQSYVAGAPRSEGTGQVLFFSKDPRNYTDFAVDLILSGDKFASSFGYSITSGDFNNDGYRDLVVGAPFYYEKEAGGAIYIYINSRKGFTEDTKPIIITGKNESRFGFALEETGDLNKDGYPDLAVGAPYEESGGTVYIYSGSKSGLVTDKPSQIIRATDIPVPGIKTFGYSLSGGLDLDENGYPDLAIGAYEVDTVVLLRTRPVVEVKTEVKGDYHNIDPKKSGCRSDEFSKKTCFEIRPCFTLKSHELTKGRGSAIYFKSYIEAETFSGKLFSRVSFNSSKNSTGQHIFSKEFIVRSRDINKELCVNETVYIKDKDDFLNPIAFRLTYSIDQSPPIYNPYGPLPEINNYPILDQVEASKIFTATFLKECGDDDLCHSDLRLKTKLNLDNIKDNIYNLILGNGSFILDITVENRNEPAYDANLYIIHPTNVKMTQSLLDNNMHCSSIGQVATCGLGNPMASNTKVSFSMKFDPLGVSDSENVLPFQVFLNTSSINKPIKPHTMDIRIIRKAEISITGKSYPSEVFYGGIIKGASAMVYQDEIGPVVTHKYSIFNKGPLTLRTFRLYIDWPYEVASSDKHGKYALYMTENPIGGSFSAGCQIDPSFINSEKIAVKNTTEFNFGNEESTRGTTNLPKTEEPTTETSKRKKKKGKNSIEYNNKDDSDRPKTRRKRELVVQPQDVKVKGKSYQVVKMNCKDKTAKCVRFFCTFNNIRGGIGMDVTIKARLWNSTFAEDYPDVHWVEISSNATIEIDSKYEIRQDTSDDSFEIVTKVTPDLVKFRGRQKKPVPIWIIIVSVLAGMFLLAIVVLLLIKFGFFKRKKPGYILTETSEKPINDY